jgi:pimeloyl-ACP methyl ester carboxylesterase
LKWLLFFTIVTIGLVALAGWLWTPDKDLAVLEAIYAKPPSEFKQVAGARLHLRDTGSKTAPALILLHGFGSSLHTWDQWSKELEKTYRVIRLDLLGSGLTGPDPQGDYSDARALALLSSLMSDLGLQKATFIGNSIGGRIAWRFAAEHPTLTHKLVLISPDGFESPGFEYGKAPNVPAFLALMRYTLPKFMMKINLTPAYGTPSALTPSTLTRYHDLMLVPGARTAMLDRMKQIMLTYPMPILKTIQAPTLLLWGDKDAMIPISNAKDYLSALPNSRLVTLENMGHVPFEENPALTLAPLIDFLKQ